MSRLELIDPTAAKIVAVAQRGDSIHRISEKIGISYSWVHDWIKRLSEKGIITITDNGIAGVDHEIRQRYVDLMAVIYEREGVDQTDAYVIPHFAGMEFAFTEIDAAYVWTHGGFQIARSHDDYPVFIAVHDRDVERWIAFFEQFGIDVTVGERPDRNAVDGAIHYVVFPTPGEIDVEWVDGHPVIPVGAAVEQMREHRPAYEPSLEMIAEEYDVDIDAHHDGSVSSP